MIDIKIFSLDINYFSRNKIQVGLDYRIFFLIRSIPVIHLIIDFYRYP